MNRCTLCQVSFLNYFVAQSAILAITVTYPIVDSVTVKIPIFGFHSVIDRENFDKFPSRASYLDYTKQDFDDGYINANVYLMPILKDLQNKYNKRIKVILFVNPKFMEKKQTSKVQYLKCQDLTEGIGKGFYDVQSHGFSHSDLTKLNTETLQFELAESQKYLKNCTLDLAKNSTIAEHLAYPYNRVNSKVLEYTSKYL
jgi:peptidoglycan/xylan/chitin deacetylase (PgdA/CDA1 family)